MRRGYLRSLPCTPASRVYSHPQTPDRRIACSRAIPLDQSLALGPCALWIPFSCRSPAPSLSPPVTQVHYTSPSPSSSSTGLHPVPSMHYPASHDLPAQIYHLIHLGSLLSRLSLILSFVQYFRPIQSTPKSNTGPHIKKKRGKDSPCGRSCLFAKTINKQSFISLSAKIRSSSWRASSIRSRSAESMTNMRPWVPV